MIGFDFAQLERRIAALEAAAPSSLRFGRVTGVEGGKCRVQFRDGQDMVSHPLSTLQRRVLKDQDMTMPDVGEPVACLFSGQGHAEGVVLGAYYNGTEQAPNQPPVYDYRRYADGTELWYDRENHKLIASVQGDIVATVTGDVELKTEGTVSVKAKGPVSVASQGAVSLESADGITLKAPTIGLRGNLTQTDVDGGPASSTLSGTFRVRQGDVIAESVSLVGHAHEGVESGPDTTGVPVGGA